MADQYQKHLDNFAAHKDDLISQLRAKGSQQMFEVASLRGDTRYTSLAPPPPVLAVLSAPPVLFPVLLSREQAERRTMGLIMSSSNALCLPPSCPTDAAASNSAEEACSRWDERRRYRSRSYFLFSGLSVLLQRSLFHLHFFFSFLLHICHSR